MTRKSWRDAYPLEPRIVLRHTADWRKSAEQIRRLLPAATIVVQVSEVKSLLELLDSPHCSDVVRLDTWLSQWTLEPAHYVPDKVKEVLRPLQALQDGIAHMNTQPKIELQLRIRSTQLALPALRNALGSLSFAIFHLRVLESLTSFATQAFPLTNVRILSFSLPYRYDLLPQFHAAVISLPQLREMHIFSWTINAVKHVNRFLKVLDSVPNVTALRVATRHFPLELCASFLTHVTQLELSWGVTVDYALPNFGQLCFANIQQFAAFDGYAIMFSQIAHCPAPAEICVQACNATTLLNLPSNLRHLSLMQKLECITGDVKSFLDCGQALSRLSMLQVFQIGDFLTDHVLSLLLGVVMPQVHTFGFQLSFDTTVRSRHLSQSGDYFKLSPSQSTEKHAAVFPALKDIKISYTGSLQDRIQLEASFISQEHFPCLRGLTYSCHKLQIEFPGMSPACYIVKR